MKRKISLIITFICIGLVAFAQNKSEQADAMIEAFLEKTKVPGLSISVSQKGELVYSKGFGYADLENQIPVDPSRTKFRIGSVSKTVTAAGLAKLYEAGKVDLDAPIQRYVPIWPDKGETITLRMLAGHLAGIRHYKGLEFMSNKKYEDVIDGLGIFIDDPLINKPGTEYRYSSYGWNLISVAMENAATPEASFLSDVSFLGFIQSEVFDAIGMDNTVPDHADREIANRTKFYQINNQDEFVEAPYVDNSCKWAGGGFVGTTEDLCTFGQAHMKEGYLKQSTLDEWMKSQKTSNGKETGYGMGWRTVKIDGYEFVGHSGGSVGGITWFIMHKPSETVLAITGNVDPLPFRGIQNELLKLFVN